MNGHLSVVPREVQPPEYPSLVALGIVGRPDSAFDRLTRLASLAVRAPIALVTVLDDDRQLFASCIGLPEPWASMRETPLSHSFCQHVISCGELLIIEDARNHPLVHDNPAIHDLGVVAYLGIPLVVESGDVLGTFCVIDSVPRTWTPDEIEMVASLAESAMAEIGCRHVATLAEQRAHDAERASREREAVLRRMTDAVYALDHEWRFTYLNPKCDELLGRRGDELLGKVIWDAFPEAAEMIFRVEYERAMRDRVTVAFDVFYPPLDKWFEVRGYPSSDGLSVYFRDITTGRAMREQVAFQARLLDNVGDAVMATDLDGTITYWNRAAEGLYGWTRDEALGRNVVETTVPEGMRGGGEELLAHLASGATWSGEFDVQHRDGAVFPVEATNAPVYDIDGQHVGIVSVSADIRGRKQMEAALHAHVRGREEFLSMAAHELKTPLTTIKGMTQLIERRVKRGDEIGELPIRLNEQVDRMQMLVNDLLDVSRLQSGIVPPRPQMMSLSTLVHEVAERFAYGSARHDGHRLVIDAQHEVIGVWDHSRLDQVITNLLSNAFKYSPDGGEVRVTVREETDAVVLTVSDQGVGIDPLALDHIFEPFVRVGGSKRDVTGTGLGLHITKRIIQRHGGEITVESAPGHGSTFTVRLPNAIANHGGDTVEC